MKDLPTRNTAKYYEGDIVVFMSKTEHEREPSFYPAPGTTGVIEIADTDGTSLVRWEEHTTSGDDKWWCRNKYFTIYDNGSDVSFETVCIFKDSDR